MKTMARKRPDYQKLQTLDTFFKQNTTVILRDKNIKKTLTFFNQIHVYSGIA